MKYEGQFIITLGPNFIVPMPEHGRGMGAHLDGIPEGIMNNSDRRVQDTSQGG